MPATSQIRQNFHADSERAINEKINETLHASYVYLSMAFHFDRDDVALANVSKHFKKMSENKRDMAKMLMEYQNSRGGRVILSAVDKPSRDDWGSAKDALEDSLELEKAHNTSFMHLHTIAETTDDAHLSDFVEEHLLETQVELIKKVGDYVTAAKRAGSGLGEYVFDKEHFED